MNSPSAAWGWRLTFVAGLMPALAGTVGLSLALISMSSGHAAQWKSLMGNHPFTADDIGRWNPGFLALWKLVNHLGGVNLMASGITIAWLSWSGLRAGHRWVRPILWFLFLWVGGNDTLALLRFREETGQGLPTALITVALGSLGLVISRRQRS